jgi:hypothetical protein
MSGLLRRLAATATGSANRVRSDVRAASNGAMTGGIGPSESDNVVPSSAQPLPALAERSPQSPLIGMTLPPRRPDESRDPGAPFAVHASPAAMQEDRGQSTTTSVDPSMRPGPTQRMSAGDEISMSDAALAVAHFHTETRNVDRVSARGVPDTATEPLRPHARARNEPAPLLPRAASEGDRSGVRGPPISAASQASSPQSSAADDTAEVHIYIGRIDVTAVHEAPQSRRKMAQARAPRSLDDYLSRRSR